MTPDFDIEGLVGDLDRKPVFMMVTRDVVRRIAGWMSSRAAVDEVSELRFGTGGASSYTERVGAVISGRFNEVLQIMVFAGTNFGFTEVCYAEIVNVVSSLCGSEERPIDLRAAIASAQQNEASRDPNVSDILFDTSALFPDCLTLLRGFVASGGNDRYGYIPVLAEVVDGKGAVG